MSGYVPVDHRARDGQAIEVLRSYYERGHLQIPDPWINERGGLVASWDEQLDGDAFACYLDILGLNGRPIRENTSPLR